MKIKFKLSIFFLFAYNSTVIADEILLDIAKKRPDIASASNPDYVLSRKIEIPVAMSQTSDQNKTGRMIGFVNVQSAIEYYVVSKTPFVHLVNPMENKYLGGWKLTPFADEELESEIDKWYNQYEIVQENTDAMSLLPKVGCYFQQPLRYGDLTGDAKPELLVYTHDQYDAANVVIFSPELKRQIFSIRYSTYDSRLNEYLEPPEDGVVPASEPLANAPTDPQYVSRVAEDNSRMVRNTEFSVINFAKIYIADFDGDEKQDLLSWRKLYRSRENQDPIKGFQIIRDQLIHYKLVDGEYKKQPTEQSVIKGWLEAKNLTWQKGYPSKSECPGQEGKLIPEMHDPLLNDPDVLK